MKIKEVWKSVKQFFSAVKQNREYADIISRTNDRVFQLELQCASLELRAKHYVQIVSAVIDEQIFRDNSKSPNDAGIQHGVNRLQSVRQEILKRISSLS